LLISLVIASTLQRPTDITFLKPIPIFEIKYRLIISVVGIIGHLLSLQSSDSHIRRYSNGQILADNIGGPIYALSGILS